MIWQVLILISAFFKASQDVAIKKLLNKEHTTEALLNIYILSLLFLLPFLLFVNFNYSPKIYFLLIIRAAIIITSNILFYKAVRHSDLSIVVPFYNLSPVFLIFTSFLFLGEVLTLFEFGGILLLILGSFFLKNESTSIKDHRKFFKSKYFYYVVSALVLWSFSAVISKHVAVQMRTLDMLIFSIFFGAIFLLLYHSLKYDGIIGAMIGIKSNFRNTSIASILGLSLLHHL